MNSFSALARFVIPISLLFGPVSALATETTSFEYDALGRLVKSTKSGGPADGVEKSTSFDPAGNRTNRTVTGAENISSGGGTNVIVLPINGFLVIPVGGNN